MSVADGGGEFSIFSLHLIHPAADRIQVHRVIRIFTVIFMDASLLQRLSWQEMNSGLIPYRRLVRYWNCLFFNIAPNIERRS